MFLLSRINILRSFFHRPFTQRLSLSLLLLLAIAMWGVLGGAFSNDVLAGNSDSNLQLRTLGSCTDTAGLGVVTAGLGTDSLTGGTFTISGIPTGASVYKAWLYWNGSDSGTDANDDPATFNPDINDGDPTVTLNGQQVPAPTRLGGPAYWEDDRYAYGYRSDVTTLVTGNGSYAFAGMDDFDGPGGYNNGASLAVVYQQPGRKPTLIALAEGLDLGAGLSGPSAGPGIQAVVLGFTSASDKRQAAVSILLGGAGVQGQTSFLYESGVGAPPPSTALSLIGRPKAQKVPNVFTGLDNQNNHGYWDNHKTTLPIPAGSSWLAFQPDSEQVDLPAEIDWVAAVIELPLACTQKLHLPLLLHLK